MVSIGSRADQIIDDADGAPMDLLLDPPDVARGERRADQSPVDGVLRRIHRQEERGDALDFRRHRIQGDATGRGEQLGMSADVGDIGAPGQGPEAGLFDVEQ